jgi:hypothetical protein
LKEEIQSYNNQQSLKDKEICDLLAKVIEHELIGSESKIWHAHPVWFLDKNPIVGYSNQKKGIRLLFWSGADFDEEKLNVKAQKFKDASVFYNDVAEVNTSDLIRWINKSIEIQWDYKNLIKRKGELVRLK